MIGSQHLCLVLGMAVAFSVGCVLPPEMASSTPVPSGDAEAQRAPVVVGYLPAWRIGKQGFDAKRLGPVTDLIYFGTQVTKTGAIPIDAVDAEKVKRIVELKRQTGRRLLLCVGGWERSEHFAEVASDPDQRRVLARSLLNLCEHYGFDGVDFDWEHPEGEDELEAYAELIEETAALLRPGGRLVTVAQAGWQDLGKRAYAALDRVHLMCYDQAFPQATMAHARKEVAQLIEWGCPPEKITLGLPFYGRNKDRKARPYASLAQDLGPGQWDASLDLIEGYAFNGPDTVQAKTLFAIESGLAGVMIWELGQDLPGHRSLLSGIERGLPDRGD